MTAETFSQPHVWSAATARLEEFAPFLPRDGERVAVLGCGTSWFMAQAYAALREERGQGLTDAYSASEHRLARDYDRVVLLTRSGTTTEVCRVLEELRESGTAHVSIVATPGTPVVQRSAAVVVLPEADEQSVVQTRFATTALAVLRASLGDDLAPAIADARAVLDEPEQEALSNLVDVDQVTFLGHGWTVGLANEAALKLREAAQFWTESYPAMEYRHGPISIAAPGRAVWAFGAVPDGLGAEVQATGAHFEHRSIDPMAELVRVHRYSLLRARLAGLNPDEPRNLTRSIVLT
ncbi:MAG: SIS domain-containing protein [Ornithinimicrobium sp.]